MLQVRRGAGMLPVGTRGLVMLPVRGARACCRYKGCGHVWLQVGILSLGSGRHTWLWLPVGVLPKTKDLLLLRDSTPHLDTSWLGSGAGVNLVVVVQELISTADANGCAEVTTN